MKMTAGMTSYKCVKYQKPREGRVKICWARVASNTNILSVLALLGVSKVHSVRIKTFPLLIVRFPSM